MSDKNHEEGDKEMAGIKKIGRGMETPMENIDPDLLKEAFVLGKPGEWTAVRRSFPPTVQRSHDYGRCPISRNGRRIPGISEPIGSYSSSEEGR
jgi:hypothetical protein